MKLPLTRSRSFWTFRPLLLSILLPSPRPGYSLGVLGEIRHGPFEVRDALEAPSGEGVLLQLTQPPLYQVRPRGAGRGEVDAEPRATSLLTLDAFGLVHTRVVQRLMYELGRGPGGGRGWKTIALSWIGTRTVVFTESVNFFREALGLRTGIERSDLGRFDLP